MTMANYATQYYQALFTS
jgi:hypothetical protein